MLQKKDSKLNQREREWNDRCAAGSDEIPEYDALSDRHCPLTRAEHFQQRIHRDAESFMYCRSGIAPRPPKWSAINPIPRLATLEVLKSIDVRESTLHLLRKFTLQLRKDSKSFNQEFQRLRTNLVNILSLLRAQTVDVAEAVANWKRGYTSQVDFLWNGISYFDKMHKDVDFLDTPSVAALLSLSHMPANILVFPIPPLPEPERPTDESLASGSADVSTPEVCSRYADSLLSPRWSGCLRSSVDPGPLDIRKHLHERKLRQALADKSGSGSSSGGDASSRSLQADNVYGKPIYSLSATARELSRRAATQWAIDTILATDAARRRDAHNAPFDTCAKLDRLALASDWRAPVLAAPRLTHMTARDANAAQAAAAPTRRGDEAGNGAASGWRRPVLAAAETAEDESEGGAEASGTDRSEKHAYGQGRSRSVGDRGHGPRWYDKKSYGPLFERDEKGVRHVPKAPVGPSKGALSGGRGRGHARRTLEDGPHAQTSRADSRDTCGSRDEQQGRESHERVRVLRQLSFADEERERLKDVEAKVFTGRAPARKKPKQLVPDDGARAWEEAEKSCNLHNEMLNEMLALGAEAAARGKNPEMRLNGSNRPGGVTVPEPLRSATGPASPKARRSAGDAAREELDRGKGGNILAGDLGMGGGGGGEETGETGRDPRLDLDVCIRRGKRSDSPKADAGQDTDAEGRPTSTGRESWAGDVGEVASETAAEGGLDSAGMVAQGEDQGLPIEGEGVDVVDDEQGQPSGDEEREWGGRGEDWDVGAEEAEAAAETYEDDDFEQGKAGEDGGEAEDGAGVEADEGGFMEAAQEGAFEGEGGFPTAEADVAGAIGGMETASTGEAGADEWARQGDGARAAGPDTVPGAPDGDRGFCGQRDLEREWRLRLAADSGGDDMGETQPRDDHVEEAPVASPVVAAPETGAESESDLGVVVPAEADASATRAEVQRLDDGAHEGLHAQRPANAPNSSESESEGGPSASRAGSEARRASDAPPLHPATEHSISAPVAAAAPGSESEDAPSVAATEYRMLVTAPLLSPAPITRGHVTPTTPRVPEISVLSNQDAVTSPHGTLADLSSPKGLQVDVTRSDSDPGAYAPDANSDGAAATTLSQNAHGAGVEGAASGSPLSPSTFPTDVLQEASADLRFIHNLKMNDTVKGVRSPARSRSASATMTSLSAVSSPTNRSKKGRPNGGTYYHSDEDGEEGSHHSRRLFIDLMKATSMSRGSAREFIRSPLSSEQPQGRGTFSASASSGRLVLAMSHEEVNAALDEASFTHSLRRSNTLERLRLEAASAGDPSNGGSPSEESGDWERPSVLLAGPIVEEPESEAVSELEVVPADPAE